MYKYNKDFHPLACMVWNSSAHACNKSIVIKFSYSFVLHTSIKYKDVTDQQFKLWEQYCVYVSWKGVYINSTLQP